MMRLICIKHPHEEMSFGTCLKCMQHIPSKEWADVIGAIRDEYEIQNRLAEKCSKAGSVANV